MVCHMLIELPQKRLTKLGRARILHPLNRSDIWVCANPSAAPLSCSLGGCVCVFNADGLLVRFKPATLSVRHFWTCRCPFRQSHSLQRPWEPTSRIRRRVSIPYGRHWHLAHRCLLVCDEFKRSWEKGRWHPLASGLWQLRRDYCHFLISEQRCTEVPPRILTWIGGVVSRDSGDLGVLCRLLEGK